MKALNPHGNRSQVVCDASSAILLTRADLMSVVIEAYATWTPPSAFDEMTRPGYPGSRELALWGKCGRLKVAQCSISNTEPASIASLDPGERDSLRLMQSGIGDFLIIDDGPGVRACRQLGIAHANALLMARILNDAGTISNCQGKQAMDTLERLGRYSAKVISFARTCDPSALIAFYPNDRQRHD